MQQPLKQFCGEWCHYVEKKGKAATIFKEICETPRCTEVSFTSLLSGGFITAIAVNTPVRKLSKRTSVHWAIRNLF